MSKLRNPEGPSDAVVNGGGGIFFGGAAYACGDAGDGDVRGDILKDDAAGTDFASLADPDIAEDFGTGADEDAGTDLGMAVAAGFPGTAKGDLMEEGDIVFDDGGFADDDAGGVVEENAGADAGGGVDIDGEDLGINALEVEGDLAASVVPEFMGDAVGGEGKEALVVENGGEEAIGGRVALVDGDNVAACLLSDIGVLGEDILEEILQARLGDGVVAQFAGDAVGQGGLEAGIVEDGGLDKFGEDRLVIGGLFGLIAEPLPNGIGCGCGVGGHAASGFRKTIVKGVRCPKGWQ